VAGARTDGDLGRQARDRSERRGASAQFEQTISLAPLTSHQLPQFHGMLPCE